MIDSSKKHGLSEKIDACLFNRRKKDNAIDCYWIEFRSTLYYNLTDWTTLYSEAPFRKSSHFGAYLRMSNFYLFVLANCQEATKVRSPGSYKVERRYRYMLDFYQYRVRKAILNMDFWHSREDLTERVIER